jgi:hypothetical protein
VSGRLTPLVELKVRRTFIALSIPAVASGVREKRTTLTAKLTATGRDASKCW